jgi:hypothetical protein
VIVVTVVSDDSGDGGSGNSRDSILDAADDVEICWCENGYGPWKFINTSTLSAKGFTSLHVWPFKSKKL